MDIDFSTNPNGTARLLINGEDVSTAVKGITIRVEAGEPQVREVTLSLGHEVHLVSKLGEVDANLVRVRKRQVAALKKAGVLL